MVTWQEVEEKAPELARTVRRLFEAHKHHTIATIRRDGSPRISGTEIHFDGNHLCFGMMSDARRGHDLRRDQRVAIHSHSIDPPDEDPDAWAGEAEVSGRANELEPDGPSGGAYWVDVTEIVFTHMEGGLVVDHWDLERGMTNFRP